VKRQSEPCNADELMIDFNRQSAATVEGAGHLENQINP